MHKFRVGQKVRLAHRSRLQTGSSLPYDVVRQLPFENHEEPSYRVKSAGESHDRVCKESELEPS